MSRDCTVFSFSCHVLCADLSGQERMNLSLLNGSRAIVCFLWPALLFSISRVVSLAPHLPLFLVLGQSSLPFHHVRLQSWTAPRRQKKKKRKREHFFSSGTFFQLGIKAACLWGWRTRWCYNWITETLTLHQIYIQYISPTTWGSLDRTGHYIV